ncbi:hypothetical protein J6590_041381 [Homalodisca vitripennis]|nr:hypothetical protein J6590_041381 [Homalodisca vitripennis]
MSCRTASQADVKARSLALDLTCTKDSTNTSRRAALLARRIQHQHITSCRTATQADVKARSLALDLTCTKDSTNTSRRAGLLPRRIQHQHITSCRTATQADVKARSLALDLTCTKDSTNTSRRAGLLPRRIQHQHITSCRTATQADVKARSLALDLTCTKDSTNTHVREMLSIDSEDERTDGRNSNSGPFVCIDWPDKINDHRHKRVTHIVSVMWPEREIKKRMFSYRWVLASWANVPSELAFWAPFVITDTVSRGTLPGMYHLHALPPLYTAPLHTPQGFKGGNLEKGYAHTSGRVPLVLYYSRFLQTHLRSVMDIKRNNSCSIIRLIETSKRSFMQMYKSVAQFAYETSCVQTEIKFFQHLLSQCQYVPSHIICQNDHCTEFSLPHSTHHADVCPKL